MKLLNADLTDGDAGDMLDFVSVQEYMTRTQYTKLGLFEDINSWIDADKSIERNDYTQSLWEANEISESLYNFVPFYNLNTKIGSEDALNDYTNMTIEQFLTVEDPVSIFGSYYVREDFWHDVCVFWISQSDFEKSLIMDEQLLQKMLDFAKELPYVRNDMSDIFNNHEMYFKKMLLQSTGWKYGQGIVRDLTAYRAVAALLGEESSSITMPDVIQKLDKGIDNNLADQLRSYAADVVLEGFPVESGEGSAFIKHFVV